MYDDGFASRLDFAVEKMGGISKASAIIGTSPPTIGRWKDGTSDPKMSNILAFARAADVNLDWLMTGFGNPDMQSASIVPRVDYDDCIYIPYATNVLASAGGGKFNDGVVGTDNYLPLSRSWLHQHRFNLKDLIAINTDGDSMLPTIPENATVLIDKSKNSPRDGRIYVVRIENQLYVKRIQWIPRGGLRLISDNTIYQPMDITKADLASDDVQVYGQVVHIAYDLPH